MWKEHLFRFVLSLGVPNNDASVAIGTGKHLTIAQPAYRGQYLGGGGGGGGGGGRDK